MQILYQKFKIAKITSDRARHLISDIDIHHGGEAHDLPQSPHQ